MDTINKKKVTFEDMPRLMEMLIESNMAMKEELREIKQSIQTKADKGTLLKGYNGIKAHYRYGTDKINKLIAQGAPINKVGTTLQCYTNELDNFIASLNNR